MRSNKDLMKSSGLTGNPDLRGLAFADLRGLNSCAGSALLHGEPTPELQFRA